MCLVLSLTTPMKPSECSRIPMNMFWKYCISYSILKIKTHTNVEVAWAETDVFWRKIQDTSTVSILLLFLCKTGSIWGFQMQEKYWIRTVCRFLQSVFKKHNRFPANREHNERLEPWTRIKRNRRKLYKNSLFQNSIVFLIKISQKSRWHLSWQRKKPTSFSHLVLSQETNWALKDWAYNTKIRPKPTAF